jgi:hypothetical protein
MPIAAPVLILVAAVEIVLAALTFIPYALNFKDIRLRLEGFPPYSGWGNKDIVGHRDGFFKFHPVQAIVVGLTAAAFITALVLTIGFFTGGAGFAFMAPLFSAITAPLAMAAASAHVSLFLPALVGFCFVIAPLTIGNNLKRFLGWLDSFASDGSTALLVDDMHWTSNKRNLEDNARTALSDAGMPQALHYPYLVGEGVFATVGNGFSSVYEDKKANAYEKIDAVQTTSQYV